MVRHRIVVGVWHGRCNRTNLLSHPPAENLNTPAYIVLSASSSIPSDYSVQRQQVLRLHPAASPLFSVSNQHSNRSGDVQEEEGGEPSVEARARVLGRVGAGDVEVRRAFARRCGGFGGEFRHCDVVWWWVELSCRIG